MYIEVNSSIINRNNALCFNRFSENVKTVLQNEIDFNFRKSKIVSTCINF